MSISLTQCGAIDEHQVDVVAEQAHQANGKHDRYEEQKEYVKASHAVAGWLALFQDTKTIFIL